MLTYCYVIVVATMSAGFFMN